jgi:hypothetical protein
MNSLQVEPRAVKSIFWRFRMNAAFVLFACSRRSPATAQYAEKELASMVWVFDP